MGRAALSDHSEAARKLCSVLPFFGFLVGLAPFCHQRQGWHERSPVKSSQYSTRSHLHVLSRSALPAREREIVILRMG